MFHPATIGPFANFSAMLDFVRIRRVCDEDQGDAVRCFFQLCVWVVRICRARQKFWKFGATDRHVRNCGIDPRRWPPRRRYETCRFQSRNMNPCAIFGRGINRHEIGGKTTPASCCAWRTRY